MTREPSNPTCRLCILGRNTFYARYCTRLKRKVEYATSPPCSQTK